MASKSESNCVNRGLMQLLRGGDVCHEHPAQTKLLKKGHCQLLTACKSNKHSLTSGVACKYYDQYSAQHVTRA